MSEESLTESEPKEIESKAEDREADLTEAAQMLEEPKDGSFLTGLAAFVAWAKSLVAKKD
jgi:hypothetical protein